MTRVAVILAQAYRGGTLRAARDVACMLKTGQGPPLDVVFARVAAGRDDPFDERELRALGIGTRTFSWKAVGRADAARLASTSFPPFTLIDEHERYVVPDDGAADLGDRDFWLVISDRTPAPLLPIRPYGVMVFDCLQRFVPGIMTDSAWTAQLDGIVPLVREAAVVLVTTPVTGGDVQTFLGVPRDRIRLAPLCFVPPVAVSATRPLTEPYILWATNHSSHKNHATVLRGLRTYYEDLNGQLKTVILGIETEYLKHYRVHPHTVPEAYLKPLRTLLHESAVLRDNVSIVGEATDAVYVGALAGARLLLHSSLYDNGTFAAFDAAYLGIPTLSARYPAMIYHDRVHGLQVSWFDAHDPHDLAAQLARLEHGPVQGVRADREHLDALHWSRNADEFRRLLEPWLTATS